MTIKKKWFDIVQRYKFAVMYYVYFATCLVIALWLSKPIETLASLI